jgi:hypothetical protein
VLFRRIETKGLIQTKDFLKSPEFGGKSRSEAKRTAKNAKDAKFKEFSLRSLRA